MRGFAREEKGFMVRGMRWVMLICCGALLGGCAALPKLAPEREVAGEGRAVGVTTDILVRPRARPEGVAAVAEPEVVGPVAAPEQGLLGTTVASLGSLSEPGLWLKTPLVSSAQAGRVRMPGGTSVEVQLLPLEGPETAGSRISIGAMQALGVPLGDLPTLEVLGVS